MEKLTYFVITRKIFNSPIWNDNPHILKLFLYLVGMARYRKEPKRFNNFKVCRGELVTSLSEILNDNEYLERGRAKKWSRAKVSRMLHYLEDKKYIELLSDTYGTHVSICNYITYQDQNTYKMQASETQVKRMCNASETQVRTYNKGNKGNKDKKKPPYIPPGGLELMGNGHDWIDPESWDSFCDHRKCIKKPLSQDAVKIALKLLSENACDQKRIIEKSILNNWAGLFELKNEKQGDNSKHWDSEWRENIK